MTKQYVRKCDFCGKQIDDLYNFGVTTLYKQIRIGRGARFNDYTEGQVRNRMNVIEPDDCDGYGKGWRDDSDKEFSFCSPKCLLNFFEKLYDDTYKWNLPLMKRKKKEILDNFKQLYKSNKSWFDKIKRKFDSKFLVQDSLKELDELKKDIDEAKKQVK